MKDILNQVPERIKELRTIFGYQVEEVAEKMNIPVEKYIGYETSGNDIPISAIYQLAGLYNVEMTEILTGNSPKINTVCVVRKDEGMKVERFKGYNYENIAYKFIHKKMEPMIVTLYPNKNKPDLVVHKGQEINYCLEGEMILFYDENVIYLKEGDCAYFDASHPHGQSAASTDRTVKFLTVINENE